MNPVARLRLRPGYLVVALTAFTAVAVGATSAVLIVRHRTAALQGLADAQAVLVHSRAQFVDADLERLVSEMARLSGLAEVDLADQNMEPEKRVLRIARRDTALFSVSIFILDESGTVAWSEPQGAALAIDTRRLVRDVQTRGFGGLSYTVGEIDAAVPIAGRGAIVAQVSARTRDFFGDAILRSLHGGSAEVLAETSERDVRVTSVGPDFPLQGDFDGQSWRTDAHGERWLVTEVHIGSSGLALRVAQPARALEREVSRSVRELVGIVVLALLLAIGGGAVLAVAIRRLEQAEVELGRSRELAAMGRTAAAIAHEVKNSLNGLSIALDLLASRRAAPSAAAEVHAQARSEVARLKGVADDLTLFAAPPRLDLGEADLSELCHHAVAASADLAHDFGVEVVLDAPAEGAPFVLRGDAHKLLGAIQNLVRNGVEAMGPGAFGEVIGQAPMARVRRLDVHLRREGRCAVVEVADRGPGIAPEVRSRLFEPFVSTKRTGTGLGLAIARRVVEAHGGRVEARGREGGGTVFRLELPTEGAPRAAAARAVEASGP